MCRDASFRGRAKRDARDTRLDLELALSGFASDVRGNHVRSRRHGIEREPAVLVRAGDERRRRGDNLRGHARMDVTTDVIEAIALERVAIDFTGRDRDIE